VLSPKNDEGQGPKIFFIEPPLITM